MLQGVTPFPPYYFLTKNLHTIYLPARGRRSRKFLCRTNLRLPSVLINLDFCRKKIQPNIFQGTDMMFLCNWYPVNKSVLTKKLLVFNHLLKFVDGKPHPFYHKLFLVTRILMCKALKHWIWLSFGAIKQYPTTWKLFCRKHSSILT